MAFRAPQSIPCLQKVKSALEELAELRKSGAKRVDRFEVKEEDDVYDVVDEAEYAKLVQKRREEGGARSRKSGLQNDRSRKRAVSKESRTRTWRVRRKQWAVPFA